MNRIGLAQAQSTKKLPFGAAYIGALCLVAISSVSANATTFGFFNISNNSGQAASVATQFSVGVTNSGVDANTGLNSVAFTFENAVGITSSITAVYLDDASSVLGAMLPITSSSGVNFSPSATPPNLPGGSNYNFTSIASADSNSPNVPANGVNVATEWLTLTFDLKNNVTYNDVLAAIMNGSSQPSGLRFGLQVQNITCTSGVTCTKGNTSDAFISSVPIPATGFLLIGALGGLGLIRRRRKTI